LRNGSPPPGASILITSAPNSASMRAQNGPAISVPSSMTLMPLRGSGLSVDMAESDIGYTKGGIEEIEYIEIPTAHTVRLDPARRGTL